MTELIIIALLAIVLAIIDREIPEENKMADDKKRIASDIESGNAVLGIEFGSTRIKAVVIDEKGTPLASGSHEWENQPVDGIWTYSVDDIWSGLQD